MASTDEALEERINYRFRRKALLREALTHTSAAEGRKLRVNNERLEFLGDRVLGLAMATRLLDVFPDDAESALALRFNSLVNRDACARVAKRLALGEALVLSPSEEKTGGRAKETILADACEALIAAIYLDAGLDAARSFIDHAWADEFLATGAAGKDPKTMLQEWAARRGKPNPVYAVAERSGPDHEPHFVVSAAVDGLEPCVGEGGSKRDAERAAARALLATVGVRV